MLINHELLGSRPELEGLFPDHTISEILELKRDEVRKNAPILASLYFDFIIGIAAHSYGLAAREFDSIDELVNTCMAIEQENQFH